MTETKVPYVDKPFLVDDQPVGIICYDASHVAYLLVIDERGREWHIYGYAQVATVDGRKGAWYPQ